MKKTMFAVVCMAMMAMGCMAKDNIQKGHKGHGNAPRHEMVDPVINMKIVEEMGLTEKKVNEIKDLQTKRFEEIKNLRAELKKEQDNAKPHANAKPQGENKPQANAKPQQGKHHAPGKHHMGKKNQHFAEHKAKMNAINEKYRKDVKHIMGTDTYVKYVEKVNDHLAMNQMGKGNYKGHGFKGHHGKQMYKRGNHMHKHHGAPQQPKPMPESAA